MSDDRKSWHQPRRLYVAEFKSGVVKVGITTQPGDARERGLRHGGQKPFRAHYCDPHFCGYWAELKLIARMERVATTVPPTLEYFTGVRFGFAVTLAKQITRQAQRLDNAQAAVAYVASVDGLARTEVEVIDFYDHGRGQAFALDAGNDEVAPAEMLQAA